jgi:hypothetical protein
MYEVRKRKVLYSITQKEILKMGEIRYQVLINDNIVAQDMTLEYAMIFIKAVFHEYCNRHMMTVSIKEMPKYEERNDG